jgi:methylase of polypeptide subunit release factors
MTQLLEKAVAELQKLPDAEQDAIAARILDELTDDQRWDAAFASSQDALAKLAAKAREDVSNGRYKDLGIDEL